MSKSLLVSEPEIIAQGAIAYQRALPPQQRRQVANDQIWQLCACPCEQLLLSALSRHHPMCRFP